MNMNDNTSANINELTVDQIQKVLTLFGKESKHSGLANPLLGRRVIVRTYSAGVHIGTLESACGQECFLTGSLRLWSWSEGGLSLSAIANNGVAAGRLNRTGEIVLTEAIEYIAITPEAEATMIPFIEDEK